ncbi:MAG: 2-C-methyl-D-erythritol 2,4-cyclodiphosphate synthase [Planctomycetota bacterium]
MRLKVGHGFDIHPLAEGRPLKLGGIEVPAPFGLLGHSDGDVICHALADAILGACALGDIGEWFPDTDERFRDADSADLLGAVVRSAAEKGCKVTSVDVTVYLERPKLADFKQAMRERIAHVAGVDVSDVGLKARTFEGFGDIGEGRAAAATAVVLVEAAGPEGP